MTPALEIQKLCKSYPGFQLRDVSFSLQTGRIMGFIGRNGAGKTTTLKSILHFIAPDSGDIRFFGQAFRAHEREIKEKIGFVSGGVRFYNKKKIKTISEVTKHFYQNWDEAAYQTCLQRFDLDESKTPDALSDGMKVKYALTLALSHHAELLILDEPTSGLDPVSREDLLDAFLKLQKEGVSILFSTHITSDLEKCADDITYIRNGQIIASEPLADFTDRYRLAVFPDEQSAQNSGLTLLGRKCDKRGCSALIADRSYAAGNVIVTKPTLEQIMIHLDGEATL